MKLTRGAALLLVPGGALLLCLLFLPLTIIVEESFRVFVPGGVGGQEELGFTLDNYVDLMRAVYVGYLADMVRIGLISTVSGVALAFPLAYFIARRRSGRQRTLLIGFLVAMLFLSVLVRVYSLQLSFGPVGFGRTIAALLGTSVNSTVYAEFLVIIGLMHHNIPMSTLILVGTLQNVNPRLAEAAQALGAARWKAHLSTTIPLSIRGIMAAFLINYTIAISAFVVPWILGKGKVLFLSNLVYSRFGEVSNYPSGSAIAVQLLIISMAMIYLITVVARARFDKA